MTDGCMPEVQEPIGAKGHVYLIEKLWDAHVKQESALIGSCVQREAHRRIWTAQQTGAESRLLAP